MIVLPFNFRIAVSLSIILICLFVYFCFIQESKTRNEYEAVTGTITFLGKYAQQLPLRDEGKYRYIQLDTYPYVFELFTGSDPGDFSPKLNRIDELKQGDEATVYYYESNDIKSNGVNRNAIFIDKKGTVYFEKGSSKKSLGIIMIAIMLGAIAFSYWAWKKGKINF